MLVKTIARTITFIIGVMSPQGPTLLGHQLGLRVQGWKIPTVLCLHKKRVQGGKKPVVERLSVSIQMLSQYVCIRFSEETPC